MAAGDCQRVGGDEQPRSGHDALVDGIAQGDVGKPGALGIEVAHGREAGFEIFLRGRYAFDRAIGLRFGEHRRRHFVFGLEQVVRVRVSEARQEG